MPLRADLETALSLLLEKHAASDLLIEARPPIAKALGSSVLGVKVEPAFNTPQGLVRVILAGQVVARVRVEGNEPD